jgi:2-amino-4-hydroxy-6-hydroxymethyldihydropteridine diphosphokinase
MNRDVAYIGLGANLASAWGPPQATLTAALAAMSEGGLTLIGRSRWYRSAPVPRSDQPWFVNAVAAVAADRTPLAILEFLLAIEARFGRVRSERWTPRTLDLDLLAVGDTVVAAADSEGRLVLPHPRLHERAFVLAPLADIAPAWRHPVLGRDAAALLAALPPAARSEVHPLP